MELLARNRSQLADIIAGNAAEAIKLWDGRIITSKFPAKHLPRASVNSDGPIITEDDKLSLRIGFLLEQGRTFSTRTHNGKGYITRIWEIS